jgi:hypothetical protein
MLNIAYLRTKQADVESPPAEIKNRMLAPKITCRVPKTHGWCWRTGFLLGLLVVPCAPASDRKEDTASRFQNEIEVLKSRIAELEAQNRQVLALLSEIQSRLARGTSGSEPVIPVLPQAETLNVQQAGRRSDAPTEVHGSASGAKSKLVPVAVPAASTSTAAKTEPVQWPEVMGGGNRMKFYGLLRLDMDMDSQIPNQAQIPFFITSQSATGEKDSSNFSMHPRLTRLGFDYAASPIEIFDRAKLGGKLELDFLNGGSESRQIVRIRQAYLKLQWNQMSFLAGQTWDVVSPLFPTVGAESVMWNAGNLGDRRPQVRLSYDPRMGGGRWTFAGAIGLAGAVDMLDLDGDGLREGEVSGRPNVQAYAGYSHPLWVKGQSASFGLSGVRSWQSANRAIAKRSEFSSQAINADFTLPLTRAISLRGESWFGRNLSDVRGGIGQAINMLTGQEIRSRGGWSEIKFRLSHYLSVHPGFSLDDPLDTDIPNSGRTRNRTFYFATRINLSEQFQIGLDYLKWKTEYKGLLPGIDNRWNVFFQYTY